MLKEKKGILIGKAEFCELPEILEIQKKAFRSEAVFYNDFNIHPLRQTIEEISEEFKNKLFLKASIDNRVVGSVRAAWQKDNQKTCFIEKLFVHPGFQRRGIGYKLLENVQEQFAGAEAFELRTGKLSEWNIRLYEKAGFRIHKEQESSSCGVAMVLMRKDRS